MQRLPKDTGKIAKIVAENISMLCRTKDSRKDKPKMAIARLCDVAPSAVTKWTDGRILPSVVYLMIIAEYFGVDLMWLLTQHDDVDLTSLLMKEVS